MTEHEYRSTWTDMMAVALMQGYSASMVCEHGMSKRVAKVHLWWAIVDADAVLTARADFD